MKGRKGCWPFKFPRSHFVWEDACNNGGGGATMSATSVSASSLSESGISDQNMNPIYLKDKFLIAHTGSHKLCVSCSRNTYTVVFHRVGLGDGQWLLSYKLKLATIYHPSLPLKVEILQQIPEFQNDYIRQIRPWQLWSRWRDRFLLPTLPSSQNPSNPLNFILVSQQFL